MAYSTNQRSVDIPNHVLSNFLWPRERQTLIQWLGSETSSLASGVCQLLIADNKTRQWSLLGVGVVCLVKDFKRRRHSIQFFDQSGQVLLEQRLYQNFATNNHSTAEKLLQFEGDEFVYGLNFSDTHEARTFRFALHKREGQRQKLPDQSAKSAITSDGIVCHSQTGTVRSVKNKKKQKKLTRADIGLPSEFRHLSHFDITPEKSFVKDKARSEPKLNPHITTLLESIGEQADQMPNDEQEFVREFFEKQIGAGNVEHQMTGETMATFKNPSPIYQSNLSTTIRQPSTTPQSQNHFYSAVPKAKIVGALPPPAPPLDNFNTMKSANAYQPTPPPPPPPPLPGPLAPLDITSNESSRANVGNNARNDFLAQIQQGTKLRSTGDTLPRNAAQGPLISSSAGPASGGGIAAALARALAERRAHMKEEASGNEEDEDTSDSAEGDWD